MSELSSLSCKNEYMLVERFIAWGLFLPPVTNSPSDLWKCAWIIWGTMSASCRCSWHALFLRQIPTNLIIVLVSYDLLIHVLEVLWGSSTSNCLRNSDMIPLISDEPSIRNDFNIRPTYPSNTAMDDKVPPSNLSGFEPYIGRYEYPVYYGSR
jgi:hypothetical protein